MVEEKTRQWHEVLPESVRLVLNDNLWRAVDGYRDVLWAVVVCSPHDKVVDLKLFFERLGRLVDGAIVVDATGNKEHAVDTALRGQGFAYTVLCREWKRYDELANQALALLNGRCKYVLNLLTSEIPVFTDEFKDRSTLLKLLDAKLYSVYVLEGFRQCIFAVQVNNHKAWTCFGAAHPFIEATDRKDRLLRVLPRSVTNIWISHRGLSFAELQENIIRLEEDVKSGDMKLADRARFYIGSCYFDLRNYGSKARDYEDKSKEWYRQLLGRPTSCTQEKYVACWRLTKMLLRPATPAHDDELSLLALDSVVIDPRRYEVLIDVMYTAMRERRQTLMSRVAHLSMSAVNLRSEQDPAQIQIMWAVGRVPQHPWNCLFPAPGNINRNFLHALSDLLVRISPQTKRIQKTIYAGYNTLLKMSLADKKWDDRTNDARYLAQKSASWLSRAFTASTPLPLHIWEVLNRPYK